MVVGTSYTLDGVWIVWRCEGGRCLLNLRLYKSAKVVEVNMKRGYRYKRVECSECGIEVAENWLLRHLKDEHPDSVKIQVKTCRASMLFKRGYSQWYAEAERRMDEGQEQVFCRLCRRWQWPDELCKMSRVRKAW